MNKLTSQLSDTRVYTASIDGTVAVRDFEGRDSKGIWIHFKPVLNTLKGTESRERYFLVGLNILISAFCVFRSF